MEEREERAEQEVETDQGLQGSSKVVEMEQVEQEVGNNQVEGNNSGEQEADEQQSPDAPMPHLESLTGSAQERPMSVEEPAAEPQSVELENETNDTGVWSTENTEYGPVRTSSLTHAMRNSLNSLDFRFWSTHSTFATA